MEYIGYIRVSTKKQNHGLAAQTKSIKEAITQKNGKLLQTFQDKESGTHDNRQGLAAAIQAAKQQKATLIIAKLDRLARNVRFIFELKEQLEKNQVQLEVLDLPNLNTLTIGIFATFAQHEREVLSKRTKDGLAAAKASGKKLGRPSKKELPLLPAKQTANQASRANSQAAHQHQETIKETIIIFRKSGQTLQQIADNLNKMGHRTRRGLQYSPTAISRIIGSTGKNTNKAA